MPSGSAATAAARSSTRRTGPVGVPSTASGRSSPPPSHVVTTACGTVSSTPGPILRRPPDKTVGYPIRTATVSLLFFTSGASILRAGIFLLQKRHKDGKFRPKTVDDD